MMTYDQAIEYVNRFSKSGTPVRDLVRFVILMRSLGNPHNEIKTIHIAGTNGKGSTAQMVANILCAKGYKVGLFTSPHLIKINERISIQQFDLSQADETDGDTDNRLCKIAGRKCIFSMQVIKRLHASYLSVRRRMEVFLWNWSGKMYIWIV